MRTSRKKDQAPAVVVPPEVSGDDRTVLTNAYQTGLILSWKRDIARGYCLSLPGRPDEYVDVNQLAKYVEKLKTR